MLNEFLMEIQPVLFMVLVGLFFVYAFRLERSVVKKRPLTDADYLAILARKHHCSEYDIFSISAEDWRFSKAKVDSDFKNYLLHDNMPYYVKEFVKKHKGEIRLS